MDTIKRKFKFVIDNDILKVINSFVTKDNINKLLSMENLPNEIDLLSIDIDGNDYYLFEYICTNPSSSPRVVVIEYNGKFPPECNWKMPYCKDYIWNGTDRHGASLKALEELGNQMGYVLVGTNINGINAFFVRRDIAKDLFPTPPTSENLYNPLRLFMRFKNGHPADHCLVDPTLQMEYLFTDKDIKYVLMNGFDGKEMHEDNKYHQWMIQKKGIAFYKMDLECPALIEIDYSCCGIEMIGKNKLEIRIIIDELQINDMFKIEEIGVLQVPLNHAVAASAILKIEFIINHLWKPSEIYGSADNRELGIAIHNIKARSTL